MVFVENMLKLQSTQSDAVDAEDLLEWMRKEHCYAGEEEDNVWIIPNDRKVIELTSVELYQRFKGKEMKIPTVKIEFHYLPDFIMTEEQYKNEGKFIGLIKGGNFIMSDVKKVHHVLIDEKDYPSQAWEG